LHLFGRQVAIIHVEERDFQLEPITLQTVRPFVMDDLDLDAAIEEAQVKIDEKQGVIKVLKKKINELIARADQEWMEKNASLPIKSRPEKMLPLVRLRVAYTRHEIGNIVRFGQAFVDKVANPRDLLQFHKKKAANAVRKNANLKDNYLEPTEEMLPSEKLEKVHMSDLVQSYLSSQSLQILNPAGLERAVMNFVDKDDRDAIGHFVEKEMKTTNLGLVAINPDEAKLNAELERIREEKMRLKAGLSDKEGDDEDDDDGDDAAARKKSEKEKSSTRRKEYDTDDSMFEDLDDDAFMKEFEATQEKQKRASPDKIAGRKSSTATSSRATPKMSQSKLMFRGNSDDDDDDDELSEPSPPPAKAATSSRAAALKASSSTASRKKAPARKQAPASTSRATGARAAAKKASSKFVESQADDGPDDDEPFVIDDSDDEFERVSKATTRTTRRK
jgi:double-strand break repair protein MRE11